MNETLPPLTSFMGNAPQAGAQPLPASGGSSALPPLSSFIAQPAAPTSLAPDPNSVTDSNGNELNPLDTSLGSIAAKSMIDMTNQWKGYYNDAKQNISDAWEGKFNALSGIHVGGDIAGTILAPFGAALNILTGGQGQKAIQGAADHITNNPASVQSLNKINDFFDANPDVKQFFSQDLPNLVNAGLLGGGGEEITPDMADSAAAAPGAITDAASTVKNAITPLKDNDLQTIADTISPKLTAKQIQLAQAQGRILTGESGGLLTSGTPDQILTGDKVADSAFTIKEQIPDAASMKPADLYTALKGRTTDMAQELEPTMQSVQISPEDIDSMKTDLESLQDEQMKNADATEEANVAKRQKQFYERVNAITPDSTLDDLWKERISYDDSVPSNVKNANFQSSDKLQTLKEEWLQNRAILNKVITDSSNGLGEGVAQQFKDMSNMYDAQKNLLTTAKDNLELKAPPSKVIQWMKDHPYITGGIIGGAATATGIPGAALKAISGL